MYKQRDNEYHPPMTTDPSGGGLVSSAITAADSLNPAPAAAGSRKRGRDIRGLQRFRTVVYGEDGFQRLHAMVTRNPTLMYPPPEAEAARERVAQRQQQQLQQQLAAGRADGHELEEDVFALFDERRAVEQTGESTLATGTLPSPSRDNATSLAALRADEELARTHHRQLDTFLHLLYEFNHVSFVKLPMEDTLQLLSRCGKEAVAHVVEYETQLRVRRQARIAELHDLQKEKAALAQRRRAAEEAEQARLLAAAEQQQAELDLLGEADIAAPASGGAAEEEQSVNHRPTSPQVHFMLGEKVKEEEEVKDTDLVETALTVNVQLPLVGEAEEVAGEKERADRHDNSRLLGDTLTESLADNGALHNTEDF